VKLELVLDELDLPWSPAPEWEQAMARELDRHSSAHAVLQVVLTDDETLREHNREYRGIDRPTDVLSFSYLEIPIGDPEALLPAGVDLGEYLDPSPDPDETPVAGQILVSVETVCRRGPVHAVGLAGEFAFMVVHGFLHVLGFDHADAAQTASMRRMEERIMNSLGHELHHEESGA
jgi:probable rRNA maturation factor